MISLCKCIIRRLDTIIAVQNSVNRATTLRLDAIEAKLAKIDAAVEEPEPEAVGFQITFAAKE
jgi:hypothetical protein